MKPQIRPALVCLLLLSLLTGVLYPLLVTGVVKIAFPRQAEGSLIAGSGSELIGQPFDDPRYFWGRLSATSPMSYNGSAGSGSNLSTGNPALVEQARARIESLKSAAPTNTTPIPVDLVTASASGLDPDITPASAHFQVARVARTRNLPIETVRELVARHTQGRQWGLLGESRVNVLKLNLELDRLARSR